MRCQHNRGMGLIVALLMSAFIFVWCVALYETICRDSQFAIQMERTARAKCMAQSGLSFYVIECEMFAPGQLYPPGSICTKHCNFPASPPSGTIATNYDQWFQVTLATNGDVISDGYVSSVVGGSVVSHMKLIAPGGDLSKVYSWQ